MEPHDVMARTREPVLKDFIIEKPFAGVWMPFGNRLDDVLVIYCEESV